MTSRADSQPIAHAGPAYTLSVVEGDAQIPGLRFFTGSVVQPFSVGTEADWIVAADGVRPIHLFAKFDGTALYVSAASESAAVAIQDRLVDLRWTALPPGSSLCFGSARAELRVDTRQQAPTKSPSNTGTLVIALSERAKAPVDLARTQVGGIEAILSEILIRERGAVEAPPRNPAAGLPAPSLRPNGLDQTVCDRGALREYASRLESAKVSSTPAKANDPGDASQCAGNLPAKEDAVRNPPSEPRDAPHLPVLRRLLTEMRGVSRTRLALLGLVPLTLIASLSFGAKLDRTKTQKSAQATNAGHEGSPGSAESRAARTFAANATRQTSPASSTTTVTRASEPTIPNTPPASVAPLSKSMPAVKLNAGVPDLPAARAAFRAAYEGRLDQAAAAYDSLATQGAGEMFRLATRLARAGAVRKP